MPPPPLHSGKFGKPPDIWKPYSEKDNKKARGTKTRGGRKEQAKRKLESGSPHCADTIGKLFSARTTAEDEVYLKRVFGAAAYQTMCDAAGR
jgi:hypothetical protein